MCDQSGRILGPRALSTRRRLLEATEALLKEKGLAALSVVEIARSIETSPATFYQYFADSLEAVLVLVQQVEAGMPQIFAMIDGPWQAEAGLQTARKVVRSFAIHWDEYGHILQARDYLAERGDRRFADLRESSLGDIVARLAARLEESKKRGAVDPEIHAMTAAAGMVAILERLGGQYARLSGFGATQEHFVETCARILYQVVNGECARAHAGGNEPGP
ncbi:TetR/AcrR family transcriptional regulator [Myxococcota bacterium]|nr:TetR/AcrR family transcriptional regulator [Myxococcota bacterium]